MEAVTALDKQKYHELLGWLNGTKVMVRKDYDNDSEQSISNLFKELALYSRVIKEFIEYRKNKGRKVTSSLVYSMQSIKADIERQMPKNEDDVIEVGSHAYQEFAKRWIEKTEPIEKEDKFLELFLNTFLGSSRSSDDAAFYVINMNEKKLDNFTLLCVKIAQLDEFVFLQLYETYDVRKYNEWYLDPEQNFKHFKMGGRKLSRRRKSNPKSKSKLKRRRKSSHRRQSHRRQSHRRQRH